MIVRINGKTEILADEGWTLEQLISGKGLHAGRVVVEHNFTVIPRDQWPAVHLADQDQIEIVSFVGGG